MTISIALESNLNLGVGVRVGVGRPLCCLSVINGKKSARQAAHFFPLLPGDESAVGTTGALGKRNI